MGAVHVMGGIPEMGGTPPVRLLRRMCAMRRRDWHRKFPQKALR